MEFISDKMDIDSEDVTRNFLNYMLSQASWSNTYFATNVEINGRSIVTPKGDARSFLIISLH